MMVHIPLYGLVAIAITIYLAGIMTGLVIEVCRCEKIVKGVIDRRKE